MNTEIVRAQFELQSDWFVSALKDISDGESNIQTEEYANPVKWIAGHLVSCRMNVVGILTGEYPDNNYQVWFGKGTPGKVNETYPSIGDIINQWEKIGTEMIKVMKNIKNETWHSTAPFQTSIPNNTLLGLVAYFAIHESFHIGQLSILRKSLGKSAMHMGRIVVGQRLKKL